MTEEQYHTETSDGALKLTVEADGSISKIEGGPLEEPVETGPTQDAEIDETAEIDAEFVEQDAADAAPLKPPPGGSIGPDGKVYYGSSK